MPLPAPRWIADPQLPQAARVTQRGQQLGIEAAAGGRTRWQPMEWAFGSGHEAMTLVGRRADGRYVESAITFYRRAGWDFTPGYLGSPPAVRKQEPAGHVNTADEVADCFDCHAAGVRRTPRGPLLDGIEFGVQCESCHGPGREHVEAERARQGLGRIEVPGRGSASAEVAFCARCHRAEPPPGFKVTDPVVVRFAPVGLKQSRCFRESEDTLACTSCHNAHGDAGRGPGAYRKVCTGCHGGKPHLAVCPEQPRGNCVSCHMPKRIIQRNSIFTDHWIRVPARTELAESLAPL